jgi:hypothetical protein
MSYTFYNQLTRQSAELFPLQVVFALPRLFPNFLFFLTLLFFFSCINSFSNFCDSCLTNFFLFAILFVANYSCNMYSVISEIQLYFDGVRKSDVSHKNENVLLLIFIDRCYASQITRYLLINSVECYSLATSNLRS